MRFWVIGRMRVRVVDRLGLSSGKMRVCVSGKCANEGLSA